MTLVFVVISSLAVFSVFQWKEAVRQKKIAIKERKAAEKLVDNTLFDLRDKLEPIGKLGILRSTQEAVDVYYKELGSIDLSADDKFRIATYHSDSGHYFEHIGKIQKAQGHYDTALKIMQQLVSSNPNDTLKQRNLAIVYSDLGSLQIKSGKYLQAKKNLLTALDIREKFLISDRNNTQWWQYDLVGNYGSLGKIEEINGDDEKALGYLEKSVKIAKSLLNNSENRSIQRRTFVAYFTMSNILYSHGKGVKSLNYAKEAFLTIKKLSEEDTSNAQYKKDLVDIDIYLGTLNSQTGNIEKGMKYFKNSLEAIKSIRKNNQSNSQWDKEFRRYCTMIGWIFIITNNPKKAKVFISAASEIEQTYDVVSKLGHIALMKKDYKSALEFYEKSISLMKSTKDLTEGLFEEISELLETEWCDETCRNRLVGIKIKLIFGDNAAKINDLFWRSI